MISPAVARRVVVIGGGYAGTTAANRLRKNHALDITLVNPRPEFVQRIRLHQLVAGTGRGTADFDSVLGRGVRLVVDTATRIDSSARQVELAAGDPIGYDYLVYALGSTAATPAGVAGVAEYAHRIAEYEPALRLRAALAKLPNSAPVVVVGGGLTAIETAAELAGLGRPVRLVTGPGHLPSLGDRARQQVVRQLEQLGVGVTQGATVTEVGPDRVVVSDGSWLPSALTVWAAGFGVPDLAVRSGLVTDPSGRLATDQTLTSIGDPRIVAAGDSAAFADHPLRMSCQAAMPMGIQAAETVLSRIAGREPETVDQLFVATCISLGRRRGLVQLSRADDSPRDTVLRGRTAATIKELICTSTVAGIRMEARMPGSLPGLRRQRESEPASAQVRSGRLWAETQPK